VLLTPGRCARCWVLTIRWLPTRIHDADGIAERFEAHVRRCAVQALEVPDLQLTRHPMPGGDRLIRCFVVFHASAPDCPHRTPRRG